MSAQTWRESARAWRDASWPRARHDDGNTGRSGAVGRFLGPPRERWRTQTGGDLAALVALGAATGPAFAALGGSVLQAFGRDGRPVWTSPRLPVTRVVAGGDLDGSGVDSLLVKVGHRGLALLDARDGRQLWRWRTAPGTFVPDRGGLILVPTDRGRRLVVAPTYATEIVAFDLLPGTAPVELWRIDGPWDAGFGPSLIAADMDGDGRPELVLSSRLGQGDRRRMGRTTSAERVLGRRRGDLYQAVHDLGTGALREEVAFAPVARGHRCARPYGLLTAAPLRPGQPASIVLASCQVEEYLAVTGRTRQGRLRRRWGHFVEKDWPIDDRELRVHPDALADVDGDGRPELIVSLWEEDRWRTLVLDPGRGWEAPLAELGERVCWGIVQGPEGGACLVLSVEGARATEGPTVLELRRGDDLALVARTADASVIVDEDAPLPAHVAFMARRRGGAIVPRDDGSTAVVIRRWRGGRVRDVAAWGSGDGRSPASLAPGDASRVAIMPRGLLLGSRDGRIRHVDPAGAVIARAVVRGRAAAPLVRATSTGPELLVDRAAGDMLAGRPVGPGGWRGRRRVSGTAATPLDDDLGAGHLVTVERGDSGDVLLRTGAEGVVVWRIRLDARVAGAHLPLPDGRLAVTLRRNIHSLATEIRAADGALIHRVEAGAYLRSAAILWTTRGWRLVLDDHGVLMALDAAARRRWTRDWTAAYSTPVCGPWLPSGRQGILRTEGIHGVELLDAAGRRRWRREAGLWTYDAGAAAVADLGRDGLALVMPTRDGSVECLRVETGDLRWRLDLGDVERSSVSAADLDADGRDELLVGLPDGRLLCVADDGGEPRQRWAVELDAGIASAWLADLGAADGPEIVVATVDGAVRILAPRRLGRTGPPTRATRPARRGAGPPARRRASPRGDRPPPAPAR